MEVYFKRKDYKGWKGPVVVGQGWHSILVKHGGNHYQVYTCQLLIWGTVARNVKKDINGAGHLNINSKSRRKILMNKNYLPDLDFDKINSSIES